MSENRGLLQPGFILHHRKYRDSSLILDCFTRDFGKVSLLAKGALRPKSLVAGILLPFNALALSFSGKSDLKTLTAADLHQYYPLSGLALYCGFYVNELLCKFLEAHDPHPELFNCYQDCISMLSSTDNLESILRYFELDLLNYVGYGLQLSVDKVKNTDKLNTQYYSFDADYGLIARNDGGISAQTLQQLAMRIPLEGVALIETKQLFRQIIDNYLQGKPLKSRIVLAQMMPYLSPHATVRL